MKSGKFLFLAIIFLVSLLCISAVSAADDAASDIAASSDDAVIEESISEDVSNVEVPDEEPILEESEKNILTQNEDEEEPVSSVAVGSFDTLNKDINNNDDSVIYLRYDYNYYYDYDNGQDLEYGIVIDRPLTIYGNGHTINGANQARIFWVLSSNVVFHDINFVNGKSESIGGAIYGSGGDGECVAINCTFTGNSAVYNGGAIIYGTMVEHCTVV